MTVERYLRLKSEGTIVSITGKVKDDLINIINSIINPNKKEVIRIKIVGSGLKGKDISICIIPEGPQTIPFMYNF